MCERNICFVFDKGFIQQFKVTAYSLIVNNQTERFCIHMLVSDLNDDDKRNIAEFLQKMGARYLFYEIDVSLFSALPQMGENSYATYYKLLIPKYLRHLESVLYLDCDIIVKGSIAPLFSRSGLNPVSAAEDPYVIKKQAEHAKQIVGDSFYFNAGVLLFTFEKQQHADIDQMLLYAKDNAQSLIFHDQDILNHFYAANCTHLDERYNYFTAYKNLFDIFYRTRRPIIVHYASDKPWSQSYINKFYGLYKKYYKACSQITDINFLQKRKNLGKQFFAKLGRHLSKKIKRNKA